MYINYDFFANNLALILPKNLQNKILSWAQRKKINQNLDYINKNLMIVEGTSLPADYVPYGYYLISDFDAYLETKFDELNPKKSYLYFSTSEVQYYNHKYEEGYDLEILFRKKGGNQLFDFYNWLKVPNNSDNVVSSSNPSTRLTIYGSQTDWLAPYTVYAKNNIDGDFPNKSSKLLTGGWHVYGGNPSQSEVSDYLKTAETISVKAYVDGVELSNGTGSYGKQFKLVWINRVQASNTEKDDGSGRYVIEEKITVILEDNTAFVSNEITALEDIELQTYYGLQASYSGFNSSILYVGSLVNNKPITYGVVENSGDKNSREVRLINSNDTLECYIDNKNLGLFNVTTQPYSIFNALYKTYYNMYLIIS